MWIVLNKNFGATINVNLIWRMICFANEALWHMRRCLYLGISCSRLTYQPHCRYWLHSGNYFSHISSPVSQLVQWVDITHCHPFSALILLLIDNLFFPGTLCFYKIYHLYFHDFWGRHSILFILNIQICFEKLLAYTIQSINDLRKKNKST